MKTINPKDISPVQLQQVMQTAVSPRPIALASTIDKDGNPNLSPFSFFNMFSTVPPILVFSPSRRVRDNTTKHTLENVLEVPEVVIGTVDFPIVQQISLASTEYEDGVNEFVKAGLTMKEAELVRPKLIAECPVNFECKVKDIISLGDQGGAGNLVLCEVVKIHIQEKFLDAEGNLDQTKLNMVSRLGGNFYSIADEVSLFEVPKPLTSLGIGFDNLPKEILGSDIFTGNDLGKLANVETLPSGNFSNQESVHLEAQRRLRNNDVAGAWDILQK